MLSPENALCIALLRYIEKRSEAYILDHLDVIELATRMDASVLTVQFCVPYPAGNADSLQVSVDLATGQCSFIDDVQQA